MSTSRREWQHLEADGDATESLNPASIWPDQDAPERAAPVRPAAWPEPGAGSRDALHDSPAPRPTPASGSGPVLPAAWCLRVLSAAWWGLWAKIESRRTSHGRRSLRVVETVALGEKRFVAIVQVREACFLVGGGSAGVSLLARLDAAQPFAAVLEEQAGPSARIDATRIREAW